MKALVLIIACLATAQLFAAPVEEIKPIDLTKSMTIDPIRPIDTISTKSKPVAKTPTVTVQAPQNNQGAACQGDIADQMTAGTTVNPTRMRAAARFWGSHISLGTCQGSNQALKGAAGYDAEARQHLANAEIDAMEALERSTGKTSADQISGSTAKGALDNELAAEGVRATVNSLGDCGITDLQYFNAQ